jgi:hypothetical protein
VSCGPGRGGIELPEQFVMAVRHALIHDVAVHHPQLLSHARLELGPEAGCPVSRIWGFHHAFSAAFVG